MYVYGNCECKNVQIQKCGNCYNSLSEFESLLHSNYCRVNSHMSALCICTYAQLDPVEQIQKAPPLSFPPNIKLKNVFNSALYSSDSVES